MKLLIATLLIVPMLIACGTTPSEPVGAEPQAHTPSAGRSLPDARPIMQQKLIHAQSLLRSLALEDLEEVRVHAYNLAMLSKEADWQVHRTLAYNTFSDEFRQTAVELSNQAKNGNLQGAALNYLQLTMTCIKCHSYMRHEGLAIAPSAFDQTLQRLLAGAPR